MLSWYDVCNGIPLLLFFWVILGDSRVQGRGVADGQLDERDDNDSLRQRVSPGGADVSPRLEGRGLREPKALGFWQRLLVGQLTRSS